jgi:hypothetical protein
MTPTTRRPDLGDKVLLSMARLWIGEPFVSLFGYSTPARIARDGSAAILLLVALLLIACWPFFDRFLIAAIVSGTLLSVLMRSWYDHHPARLSTRHLPLAPRPQLNISAVHVGGDVGGLIFTVGAVVTIVFSVPTLRVFLLASVACSALIAAALVGWRRTHPVWTIRRNSLAWRT